MFLDESGTVAGDAVLVVGCLKLPKASALLRLMQHLRDKTHFYGELHFTGMTRRSMGPYTSVIDLVPDDATFAASVVDRRKADPVARFGSSYDAYAKLAAQLIMGNVSPAEVVTVLADNYSAPAHVDFEGSVKRDVNRRLSRLAVVDVCRLDSKSSDALQVTDMLTSSVAFQYRQVVGTAKQGTGKSTVAEHAAARFGVSTVAGGATLPDLSVREYEHTRRETMHPAGYDETAAVVGVSSGGGPLRSRRRRARMDRGEGHGPLA